MESADAVIGPWTGDPNVYRVTERGFAIGRVFQVLEEPETWLAQVEPWWDDFPTREAAEAGACAYFRRRVVA